MPTMTLIESIKVLAYEKEKGITFVFGEQEEEFLSYGDLYTAARFCLYNLKERGIAAGDELIIQVDNPRDYLVLFWGCLLGKIIPVPVAFGNELDHRKKIISIWPQLRSPWIVSDENNFLAILDIAQHQSQVMTGRYVSVTEIFHRQELASVSNPEINEIAYVQYSSGSTGNPKGVTLTHENLQANIAAIIERSRTSGNDSSLSWMPLTHDMGMICFHLTSLVAGINQYILPTALFVRRPLLWMDKVTEKKITQLYSPNFGFQFFLSALGRRPKQNWDLSSIRIIYNGAEIISEQICHRFIDGLKQFGLNHSVIFPGYGLAEASVAVTLPNPGDYLRVYFLKRSSLSSGAKVELAQAASQETMSFVELGYPVFDCNLRITHHGKILGDRFLGDIEVMGKNVTSGYYQNHTLSKKLFTTDGWIKTGDVGFLIAGRLVMVARSKNIIIINGVNYFPHDLEDALVQQGGFLPGTVAVASAYKDNIQREVLLVFLVHKGPQKEFTEKQKVAAHTLLKLYGLSAEMIIGIKRIPKTTSGKIQHFKLAADYLAGKYDANNFADGRKKKSESLSPQDIEIHLGEAFVRAGLPDFPTGMNFFEAGVKSIQLIKLGNEIELLIGTRLDTSVFFDHPTLDSLREYVLSDAQNLQSAGNRRVSTGDQLIPVLASQRRMWALEQSRVGESFAISFLIPNGELWNIEHVRNACRELKATHPVLGTTFHLEGDSLYQKILSEKAEIDITELTYTGDEASLSQRASNECLVPFDLERGPLIRIIVWRQGSRNALQFVIHHAIFDGWSISTFIDHFLTFYRQEKASVEVDTKFQEYCFDSSNFRQSTGFQEAKEYWINEFKNGIETLNLPFQQVLGRTDRIKSAEKNVDGAFLASLTTFSRQEQVTTFAVLLGISHSLFYKYYHQPSVVTGAIVYDRGRLETSSAIGPFINTILFKSEFNQGTTFKTIVHRLHDSLKNGLKHQRFSFEDLVLELDRFNLPKPFPVFNVLIVFQDIANELYQKYPDVRLVESPRSSSDLMFEFFQYENDLRIKLSYDDGLFSAKQAAVILEHWMALANDIMHNVTKPLFLTSLLSSSEKQMLLDFSRGPKVNHQYSHLNSLLSPQIAEGNNAVAIVTENGSYRYSDLEKLMIGAAAALYNVFGVRPHDAITVISRPSEYSIALMLAAWRIGAIYVPIDPSLPQAKLQHVILDSQSVVSLIEDERMGILPTAHVISSCFDPSIIKHELPPVPLNEIDVAYIIYTSGTTGWPKGVPITHRSISDYVQTFVSFFHLTRIDVIAQQARISFDISLEEMLPILSVGGKMILIKEGGRNILGLVEKVQEFGVTILSTTPGVIKELNYLNPELTSLRLLISGGDKLDRNAISNLSHQQFKIYNTYGPTESTICATYGEVTDDTLIDIGSPIPNREIYVLNEHGQLQPQGIAGEIYIGGTGISQGYLGKKTHTSLSFVADPINPGGRLYKSGDLGRWSDQGHLEFIGRNDSQIKIRGYRIELAEIEMALRQCGASNNTVIAVEESEHEKYLVAYVSNISPSQLSEVEIELKNYLPAYMIPETIMIVDALPTTLHGKIDKKNLPLPRQLKTEDSVLPIEDQLIHRLASLWQSILKVGKVSVRDNYFRLGGHSLKAIRLLSAIWKDLHVRLELSDIYDYPDLAAMAHRIREISATTEKIIPVADHQPHYPLSSGQSRLWFLDQLKKGNPAYNISVCYRIGGNLRTDLLETVLQSIFARHDVLRTSFHEIDGKPRQRISPVPPPRIVETYDWRFIDNRHDKIEPALTDEFAYSFDLTRSPLCRVNIFRLEQDQWILTVTIHHIIADGLSLEIFMSELINGYRSELNGNTLSRVAPDMQYKDYAVWQLRELATSHSEISRTFWLNKFSDKLPVLNLSTDFPRPGELSYRGASETYTFSSEQFKSLQSFGAANGQSIFTTLQGLLFVFLNKLTGDTDIVVGIPVSGRSHGSLTDQLGFYVNTLPLRGTIDPATKFTDLTNEIHWCTLEMYEHQSFPLDELVNDLKLDRTIARSPLFDVVITYQQWDDYNDFVLEGLQLQRKPIPVRSSKFDLTFSFHHRENLLLELEYATDIFASDSIRLMLCQLSALVDSLMTQPSYPIRDLSLFRSDDKLTLDRFNNTVVQTRDDESLPGIFQFQSGIHGEKVGLITGKIELSYQLIDQQSNKIARELLSKGVLPGEKVVLLLGRSELMILGILGVLKCGACYVPVDPASPKGRTQFILDEINPRLLVSDHAIACEWPLDRVINLSDRKWESLDQKPLAVHVSPDSTAYIIYTSGSTGQPKGVLITHRQVLNTIRWFAQLIGTEGLDRVVSISNYTFDISVLEYFAPLVNGGTLILGTQDERTDYRKLIRLIKEQHASFLQVTPSILSALINEGWSGNEHLILGCGGEVLLPAIATSVRVKRMYNLYGPTEVSICSTFFLVEPACKRMTIGKPIDNIQIYIVDHEGRQQPLNVPGELWIAGAGVSDGYYARPELTSRHFCANPFTKHGRIYKTGDLGKWLSNGTIEFLGRKDEQVKIRGYRIELGEIEEVLLRYDGVKCVAVKVWSDKDEKFLAAYIEGIPENQLNSISEWVADYLPSYMIPSFWVSMPRIPQNENGKIDKGQLPYPTTNRDSGNFMLNNSQQALADLWSQVLGFNTFQPGDNFFKIGGHSLKAAQLASLIEDRLGKRPELQDLFNYPLLSSMTDKIASIIHTESHETLPAPFLDHYPVSKGQFQMWVLDQKTRQNTAYNIVTGMILNGELDEAILEQAIRLIIHRHEIFRTVFRVNAGEVRQVVLDSIDESSSIFRENYCSASYTIKEVRALMQSENEFSFSLALGPLIRVHMVRMETNKTALVINMHHIVCDAWSLEMFLIELGKNYVGLSKDSEFKALALTRQYKDYSWWQHQWLGSPAAAESKKYWKQIFSNGLRSLKLSQRLGGPTEPSSKIHNIQFLLDQKIANAAKEVISASDSSYTVFFTTCLAILFNKLTKESEIIIALPVTTRKTKEDFNQMGFYLNTLLIRNRIEQELSFQDMMKITAEDLAEVLMHKQYPFDELISELAQSGTPLPDPVFELGFSWYDYDKKIASLGNCVIEPMISLPAMPKSPVWFAGEQMNEIVSFVMTTDGESFSMEASLILQQKFLRVVEWATTSPEQPIAGCDIRLNEENPDLATSAFGNVSFDF